MLALVLFLAADAPLVGAWGVQGETVCELRADNTGQCEDGAPFRWQSNGKQIVVTDDTGMRRISYTSMKDKLVLQLDGVPVALTRMAKAKLSKKVDKDVRSRHLRQLLLAGAWCSFRYKAGFTRQSRITFRNNGTWQSGTRSETYSSGDNGTYAAEEDDGDNGRWEIRRGELYMSSSESPELEPIDLDVKQNSNGYPIIKADTTEYMLCS